MKESYDVADMFSHNFLCVYYVRIKKRSSSPPICPFTSAFLTHF